MKNEIDFQDLIVLGADSSTEYDYAFPPEEIYSYIKWMVIDLALESDYENQTKGSSSKKHPSRVGRIFGALVLGTQAFIDECDFVMMCDDCSGDLFTMANNLVNEGVLEGPNGIWRNVFYIHSLELSSKIMDSTNLDQFFELIPRLVFNSANIMPEICCYIIPSVEGYYEHQSKITDFDPRSVNEDIIDIFKENGYQLNKSKELLFRIADNSDSLFAFEDEGQPDVTSFSSIVDQLSDNDLADDLREINHKQAVADRRLNEDHITVGLGELAVHVPRTAPDALIKNIEAAIIAYKLGTGIDYSLRAFVPDRDPNIPSIHVKFQEMYFAGKNHIEETMRRMNPVLTPSSGEVYADAALSRAKNTYYVAAWLYREGHLIEAHAMSRLMLEQIAWAFSVCRLDSFEEVRGMAPTKAINNLKKVIAPVGRMYGALSKYIHLPLEGHFEFIDLSNGASEAIYQFGEYSYASGKVVSYLADYWSAVYEFTQSRHYDRLENWIDGPQGLVLNKQRPFLKIIGPLRSELEQTYEDAHGSFSAFIEENWNYNGD